MNTAAKLLTELVGTFLFLSVIALSGPMGQLAPLAIGTALMVMVYMGGHVSGGHYNPAVSLGVFLRGKMTRAQLVTYWVCQLAGGALHSDSDISCRVTRPVFTRGRRSWRSRRWRSKSSSPPRWCLWFS